MDISSEQAILAASHVSLSGGGGWAVSVSIAAGERVHATLQDSTSLRHKKCVLFERGVSGSGCPGIRCLRAPIASTQSCDVSPRRRRGPSSSQDARAVRVLVPGRPLRLHHPQALQVQIVSLVFDR